MNQSISRRKMIRQTALFAGGICTCHSILADDKMKSNCCNTPEITKDSYSVSEEYIIVDLTKVEALDTPGHAALIVDPTNNFEIIIVRPTKDDYVALSRICTHGGNVVSYNPRRNIMQCNNFNHSIFDLTGQVVKGPAIEPLHFYPLYFQNDKLVITI